jgi:hypothetical protein
MVGRVMGPQGTRSPVNIFAGRIFGCDSASAHAATEQDIGHMAVNCVRWANCDQPIPVTQRAGLAINIAKLLRH